MGDIEATGLLGYATIFNSLVPRRGPVNLPFLGLNVGGQTWVLTTMPIPARPGVTWNDLIGGRQVTGIRTAEEIHLAHEVLDPILRVVYVESTAGSPILWNSATGPV